MASLRLKLTVTVTMIGLLGIVISNPLPSGCKHSSQSQHISEESCTYGTTKDSCGNDQCMKGPGEMCGGKFGR